MNKNKMYHGPKMCRTCLQMSRGDFKFVSLDSVDPLWESNSHNLKAQLMSLVPEMNIKDVNNTYICTSCFIALRTAFEFKRMCQSTEKKFQSYNFKYRRPFGVGPGSPQFHLTLNENRTPQPANVNNNNNTVFHSTKLSYLQADTSIDITEHHLYDASKNVQRRAQYLNNVPQKNEAQASQTLADVTKTYSKQALNSAELKEKFNLGSQISIVTTDKSKPIVKVLTDEEIIKRACEEIPFLNEKKLQPENLRCNIHIQALTHDFVRRHTVEQYSLDDIKSISHPYYFGKLEKPLNCQYCKKDFFKRFLFHMHCIKEHATEIEVEKTKQVNNEDAKKHARILHKKIRHINRLKQKKKLKRLHRYKRCYICLKVGVSSLHILQHCKYVHVPRFACKKSLVRQKSETKPILRKLRARTGHPFASTFRCSICDKGFNTEKELEVHMYVHTPVVLPQEDPNEPKDEESDCQFMCYLCGKSFLKERFLKLHNIQMHLRNKPTTCKNCGRMFKSEFWYEKHKCTLPPEEPTQDEAPDETNMFPCNICERKFSQLRFMKIHRCRAHKQLLEKMGPSGMTSVLEVKKEADPMEVLSVAATSTAGEDAIEADDPNNEDTPSLSETPKPVKAEESPALPIDVIDSGNGRRRVPLKSEVVEVEQSGPGRRGNRGLPKLQCDFCGELLEENRYDKHIAEHNKSRLQRRISTNMTHIEEYDSDDFPLKCPVCYKGFKRKYYYNTHINKHIEEGIDVQEEPATPSGSPTPSQPVAQSDSQPQSDDENSGSYNSETESTLLEEDDIQGEEVQLEDNSRIIVCCGRSFRFKAHFFRHYKVTHPNNARKKEPIKFLDPPESPSFNLQNLPDLTILPEFKKIPLKKEADSSEPVVIKKEPILPNDLEIGLAEDMERGKRKLEVADTILIKKVKTDNPEAIKLRNTVAAHLDDIEIVAVSPTPSLKHECTQCDKKFKQKSQLRDHLNVHSGEKPYVCEFCQPSHAFTQSSSLYFHIRKVHTAVMKNVSWAIQAKTGLCLVCLAVFERHMAMYAHLRENYVENGFNCEICAKTVSMTCHYKVHNIESNDMDSFMLPQQNLEVVLTEDTAGGSPASSQMSIAGEEFDEDLNEADAIMNKAKRCEPCGKIFKSVQYFNMHSRGIIHKQNVEAFEAAKAKGDTIDDAAPAEVPIPTEEATPESDTIKEIEDNCKAITKKIHRIGTFKCPLCDMLFITKTHLRKHRRTRHHTVYSMHEARRRKIANPKLDSTDMESQENITNESDLTEHESMDNSVSLGDSLTNPDDTVTSMDDTHASMDTTLTDVDNVLMNIDKSETLENDSTCNDNVCTDADNAHTGGDNASPIDNNHETVDNSPASPGNSHKGVDNSLISKETTLTGTGSLDNTDTIVNNAVAIMDDSSTLMEDSHGDNNMGNIHTSIDNSCRESENTEPLVSDKEVVTEEAETATTTIDESIVVPSTNVEIDKELTENKDSGDDKLPNTDIETNKAVETLQDFEQNVSTQNQTENPEKVLHELADTELLVSTKLKENISNDLTLLESVKNATTSDPTSIVEPLEAVVTPIQSTQAVVEALVTPIQSTQAVVISSSEEHATTPLQSVSSVPTKITIGKTSVTQELPGTSYPTPKTTNKSPVKNKPDFYTHKRSLSGTIDSPKKITTSYEQVTPNASEILRQMISPPPLTHIYSNQPFIENGANMHPKYYRSGQFAPVQHFPHPQQRLPQTYPEYVPTNYYMQPHSTFVQPRESHKYNPYIEQGFVIQDDEVLNRDFIRTEPDTIPEQELLALLHNSNAAIYDAKKSDACFDSEQEFIDLEAAGPKILQQSLERLKSEDNGCVSADSSKPDFGKNSEHESEGLLPILNEMTHNFS